ncbi:MAG: VanZ family protein [Colwellia sp.]
MTWKSKLNVMLFALYCTVLMLMSGFKSAEMYLQYINSLEMWLGGDKLMHLYLALVLAFLALPVASVISVKGKISTVFTLFAMLMVCLLLDELHQAGVSTRYFDWYDTLFGGLGLMVGLGARLFFDRFIFLSSQHIK